MNEFLLLSIPVWPLLAALTILLWARKWSGVGYVAVAGSALSLLGLLPLLGQQLQIQSVWMQTGPFTLTVGLQLDALSQFMALLVTAISLLVSLYAVAYMAEEEGQPRFFASLSFFIASMLALVLSDSFLLLFAAWEGVGLASFLLIGFWYRQDDARHAALEAFLLTRLGDLGLLLGWLGALLLMRTTDIATFLDAVSTGAIAGGVLTILALLFFAGAVGKSAQLPLTAWLPAAMAGPTPVSALIHSATMVAAGVYLLLRLFPLFAAAPAALNVVFWVSGLTAVFAALLATVQTDLKRILAWSTVSQLGEMFLALGVGGPLAAAFHLAAHASFKSTLFVTAGAIDHKAGSRDLRKLGGLARRMPLTALVFGVAALALAGFPPFSGFWSEDAILAKLALRGPGAALLLILLIFLAGIYISRAGVAIFARWPDMPAPEAKDPGPLMMGTMLVLGLLAAGVGWLLAGRIEGLLPFGEEPGISLIWRGAAVTASLAGLAFGSWRVHTRGPVPALGAFPQHLERWLLAGTAAPGRAAFAMAAVLEQVEQALDRLTQRMGQAVFAAAGVSERMEVGLDQETQALARETMALASATDRVELRGFSDIMDNFARLFNQVGGRLQPFQSGKLYLYTLGIFIWVAAISVLGILAWR